MATIDLYAPDISCAHCKASIETDLRHAPGVLAVVVDVETKRVHIDFEEPVTNAGSLVDKLVASGYPVSQHPVL